MYRRTLPVLFATVSLFMGTAAMAQTTQSPATTSADTQGLDEIVVVAQRRPERLQEVPFTVNAASMEDLNQAGIISVPALQQVVPGLVWGGQGAWAEPALRGVSTTVASPGSGSPVAFYLDGVYQPQQLSTIMDLPDVTDVEVLKGPQGTLFGRNATGGAILINTVQPSFTSGGSFTTEDGVYSGGQSDTAAHVLVKGYVTGPIVDDFVAASLAAYYEYTPGYLNNIQDGRRMGEMDSEVIRGKVLWTPAENTSVLATAYYTHREDYIVEAGLPINGVSVAAAYPGAVIPTAAWTGAYFSPANPVFRLGDFGSSLKFSQTFNGAGVLTSTTGYNRYTPEIHTTTEGAYSPSCFAAFACLDYDTHVPETTVSEEVLFTSEHFGRFSFVSGIYFFYDEGEEHDRVNGGALFSADSEIYTRSQAAFAEGEYKLTDALTAVLGIRYSHETKDAESRTFDGPYLNYANVAWSGTTPRASLKYKFTDNLSTYATFSEGFKGGVVATQYTTAPPANPEKLYSYEVGAKYADHDRSLNAAFFYYKYKNLQEEYDYGLEAAPANAADATIYGVDIDGAQRITAHLSLKGGLEWLPRASFDSYPAAIAFTYPLGPYGLATVSPYNADGTRLFLAPKFSGNIGPSYTEDLPIGALDANANLYYSTSYRYEVTGRVNQHPYTTLNLGLGLAPTGHPNMRVGLYVRNATNRMYLTSALLSANADTGFYAPPREIGLSFNYKR